MTSVTRAVLVMGALLVMPRLAAQGQPPPDHLSQAERLLSTIPQESLKKPAQKQLRELRMHFAELVSAYRINSDPFVPPHDTRPTDEKAEEDNGPVNWRLKFSEVEKDLAAILGGVPSPPPSDVRSQLEQFRLELELFFASTLGMTNETRSGQPGPND
jgi:hypothetical protein